MHHSRGVLCTSKPQPAKNTFWRNKAIFGGVSPPVSTGGPSWVNQAVGASSADAPSTGSPPRRFAAPHRQQSNGASGLWGWSFPDPPVQSRLGQKFRHGHTGALRFVLDFFHLGSRKSDENSRRLTLVLCHIMCACNALLHYQSFPLDDIAMYFAISLSIHHDTPTRKYH